MRVFTDSLARQDRAAAVAVAAGVGGVLALYGLYTLTRSRKDTTTTANATGTKLHTLPSHSTIIGDLLVFARNAPRLHDWITETCLAFNGEPWRAHIPGFKTMIVVTDPAIVEDVMTTQFDTFQHGERANEIIIDFFGRAIATSDGEQWYHQRKTAAKFFTARSLRTCMTNQLRKNMAQVYDVMDAAIAHGEAIDMLKLFQEFALQTFAEIGLGIDLPLIGGPDDHPMYPMNRSIETITPLTVWRASTPRFYWRLLRWLNVGRERTLAEAVTKVRDCMDDLIDQSLAIATARQKQKRGVAASEQTDEIKSIVELFLEQSDDDKAGMQAENLKDFIFQIVLGARGTSALSLVWIFLTITKHPDVEQRIRDEMAVQLPEHAANDEAYLTSDDIHKLKYFEATIKEVLRLYPTVPLNQREAMADTTIGDGIPIKKGDFVVLHPWAMARLPSVWGPDAAEFKPDRWIDQTTGELLKIPSSKFLLFGSGPRTCIGMPLAMLELRVVIANLLKRYRFALAVPNDGSYKVSMELLPVHPVLLTVTRVTLDA